MIIGKFKQDGDGYYGKISTMLMDMPASIKSVKRDNERAPSHRIFSKAKSGIDIGAGWQKDKEDGSSHISVKLECPSLPKPIQCNLIEKDGAYLLLWSRD